MKVPVIRGMISAEGEVVSINSISVRGVSDVELWLLMLQEVNYNFNFIIALLEYEIKFENKNAYSS